MVNVKDLLKHKGNNVWQIGPKATVLDALRLMADKDVGALLVMENQKIIGIISERDFARSIARDETCLLTAAIEKYMTHEVFTVDPEQSIDGCMLLMTQKRIRHLPVVKDGELLGMISIGDVVREIIADKESSIKMLENYIYGTGYGQ
jgi:CBS domain-containing protein